MDHVLLLFIIIATSVLLVALIFYFLYLLASNVQQKKAQIPYKMVALGTENAGKTVFLAGMYYKLSIQAPKPGFFLVPLDYEQRNGLMAYRNMIVGPGNDFPPPNLLNSWKEWFFTCQVRSPTDIYYPIMNLSYLDYGGERIKLLFDVNTNQYTEEFQILLNEADVFLGLLDGQELIKLKEGKVGDDFYTKLYHILLLLQRSRQPVFIITKWDLVTAEGYSLKDILECLLKFNRFKDFVETQVNLHTLRLIPVSAVGNNFAELKPDGTISKIPGALLDPFQTEIPLSCILYDHLEASLKQNKIDKLAFSCYLPKLLIQFILFIAWLVGAFTLPPRPFAISFRNFSDSAWKILGKKTNSQGNQKVQTRRDAVTQVINGCWELLTQLEQEFPESNLTKFLPELKQIHERESMSANKLPKARAVILTAQPEAYMALCAHLSNLQEQIHPVGTIYNQGSFRGKKRLWEIEIAQIDRGNTVAATEVERATSHFNPDIILRVDLASGLKNLHIGDVIAVTKAYGYESAKEDNTGFKPRPEVGQPSYSLMQRAQAVAREGDWQQRIISGNSDLSASRPRALVEPIAAGEKVIASPNATLVNFLERSYNDAVAVDMGGYGFLAAAHANRSVEALIIYGISDLISNGAEIDQVKAARHASAFTFEILAQTDLPERGGNHNRDKETSNEQVRLYRPNPESRQHP